MTFPPEAKALNCLVMPETEASVTQTDATGSGFLTCFVIYLPERRFLSLN